MAAARGEFSSRFGFIMAAAGSAVGLGNIWGFPTQAASNGGAAFLLMYLILAFCLAYPALMAELIIGRYAKANAVVALSEIGANGLARKIGRFTGWVGIVTAGLILSFYAIVAGWMLAFCIGSLCDIFFLPQHVPWLTEFSSSRNIVFVALFIGLTVAIICGGVKNGIEKWSARLMPMLLSILLLLTAYVLTLPGAMQGLRAYLIPNFYSVFDPSLIISALGQSFFSMSLGVGTMLIYGSYINRNENIVVLGRSVTLIDIGIAFLAGLLIIPAMYVAQKSGIEIFSESGVLIAEDTLIFAVLPALFDTLGYAGVFISFIFFVLMSIAALTSSISMLEAPVSYAVESHKLSRQRATIAIGICVFCVSLILVFNFSTLFGLIIKVTTQYSQPLLGLMLCIFVGWIWQRSSLLKEIKSGCPDIEKSLFWRIWPAYVRYVCPLAIFILFANQFFS